VPSPTPRRIVDLAGSAIWLAGVGTVFTIVALAFLATPAALASIAAVAGLAAAHLTYDIRLIRTIRRFGPLPPENEDERTVSRRFKIVVIIEVAAIVAANIICTVLRLYEFITPIDVFIVGLHFLPLAWLFKAPRHYVLGAAFCAIVVAVVLLVPRTATIHHAPAWFVWISLGCGAVAIASGLGNTREAIRELQTLRT